MRDKNLYITAKHSAGNGTFITNKGGCLIAVDSYENRYNISKGHNLVIAQCDFNTKSIIPKPLGKLNEGNYLQANMRKNKIINSTTKNLSGKPSDNKNIILSNYETDTDGLPPLTDADLQAYVDNQVFYNDPLTPPWTTIASRGPLSQLTRWDASGVFVDPNRIYINKSFCGKLIYLKDPSGNNYYDISSNNGSPEDLVEILRNNTRLTNYSLTTKISLKNCETNNNNKACPTSPKSQVLPITKYITQLTDVDIIDCENNLSVVLRFSEDGILSSSLHFSSTPNVKKGSYTMLINPLTNGVYSNAKVTLTSKSNKLLGSLTLKCFTVNNCS